MVQIRKTATRKTATQWVCRFTICWIGLLGLIDSSQAKQIRAEFGFRFGGAFGQSDDDETDAESMSKAVLKTDPDLEATLEKAERFRDDGNYRIATQLWQAVLDRSGDSLYSDDDQVYYSLSRQVEQILAGLPADGLAAYRINADASAKEILALAAKPDDVQALNQIIRQYFLSSLGDDSAFQLGSIYLDSYDLVGARRIFEKIVSQYPDPSVPMDQVHMRIALCQSGLGEANAALASLEKAEAIVGASDLSRQLRQSLGQVITEQHSSSTSSQWLTRLKDAKRYGVQPGVPDAMLESDLAAVWQFYFEPDDKYKGGSFKGAILSGVQTKSSDVQKTRSSTERKLISNWKKQGWRPAGHLLFDQDRVYFKAAADMTVWSAEKVANTISGSQAQPEVARSIQWRSVWRNLYQLDEATQMLQAIHSSWGGNSVENAAGPLLPKTVPGIQFFGDQIQQQSAIYQGVLYSIEGKHYDGKVPRNSKRASPHWNATFRRTRSNFLTAYDAKTGEVKWSLPKQDEKSSTSSKKTEDEESDSPWIKSGGFMSAPVGFGDLVLVPVNQGGAITIYALDTQQQGKTVWKSFLCDEPESGAKSWAPIQLSLGGSDLFVSCGMGVVFVLDPSTGLVRFAKRYSRTGKPDPFMARSGWSVNRMVFGGWSSDMIIPHGRQMICFCSDSDKIESIDRNTGKLIWRSEIAPIGFQVDYLLGVYNDVLYAAGSETLIAYDLKGEGRMVWGAEQMFDGKRSMGRGLLTPKGIYMPVEDSIYLFPLYATDREPEDVKKVQVNLGTGAPVGNLYSDGKQFWVHGGNRLYVLGIKE